MRATTILLCLSIMTAFVTSSPTVDGAPLGKNARSVFKKAQALYDGGRYEEALGKFEAIVHDADSPNARLYVARCLRHLGRLPEAWQAMRTTVDHASSRMKDEPRYAATRDAAAAEAVKLERRIGRIVVAVAEPPDGLVVQLNGKDVPASLVGRVVAVAPGKVDLVATAPSRYRVQREVEVANGEIRTVALTLAPLQKRTEDGQEVPKADSPAYLDELGIAALGIGVAGTVTFAVAGLMANQKYDQIKEDCGGTRCTDPTMNDEIDAGKRLDTIANVGLVIGLVGLAAGGTLLVLDGQQSTDQEGLDVGAYRNGPWVSYRGRF